MKGLIASRPNTSVLIELKANESLTFTKEFKECEEALKNEKLSECKTTSCYSEFDVNHEEAGCE